MGGQNVKIGEQYRPAFIQQLIKDMEGMEYMFSNGCFEKDMSRIGVEQEMCLIDYTLHPSMTAMDVLADLQDEHFTNELARFNLELNLDPHTFAGHCFSAIENELIYKLTRVNRVAHRHGAKIILTGILPSIRKDDLILENITPLPRYYALNDAISAHRGKDFEFNIRGVDELLDKNDTVLFESCNTSFQVHYQTDAENAVSHYNWAQAIAGPVLACSVNSPMFLGKRLWKETRIALFHQSADSRKSVHPVREEWPRVIFGKTWLAGSPFNYFKENASRYKVLITPDLDEDVKGKLNSGEIPKLEALSLHNGTIYRWNRLCYGITEEKPHLRIENRYLPAGPTIVDEVANAAFWAGLMHGMKGRCSRIDEYLPFEDAKANFLKAANNGLSARFNWLDNKKINATELIIDHLLPIAEKGLEKAGVLKKDIKKYLGIIKQRTTTGRTGSKWTLNAYNALTEKASVNESIKAIVEGIYQRQKSNHPVHQWKPPALHESGGWASRFQYVEQLMTTDLITVSESEPLELVKNIMLWSGIHHVPVENNDGELTGLITAELLMTHYLKPDMPKGQTLIAGDVMITEPVICEPGTMTFDLLKIMRDNELTGVPVVQNKKLIGIFTIKDYLKTVDFLFNTISNSS
jgi:CBS domain-containing protein